jgi:ABC-type dipeptide/oligopeptide/nickel transport system ATPase subunit
LLQAQVLNGLNELKENLGFTCIFISHDLAVVKYWSDRVLVMTKGKIEEIADADYKVSLLLSRVGVVSKKYILEISKRRQIRGY